MPDLLARLTPQPGAGSRPRNPPDTMKNNSSFPCWTMESPNSSGYCTRERAAYLLRAGRSRSRGNVRRKNRHSYTIQDCTLWIATQQPTPAATLTAPQP
jgi:hypothetical protein